ncbi:hypothetical protein LTR36_001703 [Oleoguttula mirabilis]|uniref:Uncharacterized protein n=1 Tax=Oleoguttula mirabilis TaxID=1507867 RepID=A0AAV9JNK9_9PEZI|nr:hypothetical protein LTR36_001703 [Oleoguttula mirabilis]
MHHPHLLPSGLILLSGGLKLTLAHLITSPPTLPHVRPTAYPGIGIDAADALFGRLPGHQLFKRSTSVLCDPGPFFCPTGTCFTDTTGLIGCCDVTSCAPRTACIPYASGLTSPCDTNTGGCMYCSDTASPSCLTITNEGAGQRIQYCAAYASTETASYVNPITGGSQADGGVVATTTGGGGSSSLNFTPQPSQCQQPPCASDTEGSSMTSTAAGSTSPSSASTSSAASTTADSTEAQGAAQTTQSSVVAAPTGGNTTVTSASTADPHSSTSISRAVIAGIICGAAAAGALIAATLWYTRKYWLTCLRPKRQGRDSGFFNEKRSSESGEATCTRGVNGNGMLGEAGGHTPASPTKHYSPDDFSRHPELDGRPVGTMSPRPIDNITVRGLGIGDFSPQRYAPTNPDPLSATDEGSPTDYIAPLAIRHEVSEAPTDRSLPASPAVSSLAPPDTPHTNTNTNTSSPSGSNGPVSPLTPTYRYTPYTPSAYGGGNEAPSSVPRTVSAAPPSLPQDYSAVSLGSTANIYRGLSQRGGAPWAYLSPEEAVRGGWRNEEGR